MTCVFSPVAGLHTAIKIPLMDNLNGSTSLGLGDIQEPLHHFICVFSSLLKFWAAVTPKRTCTFQHCLLHHILDFSVLHRGQMSSLLLLTTLLVLQLKFTLASKLIAMAPSGMQDVILLTLEQLLNYVSGTLCISTTLPELVLSSVYFLHVPYKSNLLSVFPDFVPFSVKTQFVRAEPC